jgi:hypothetical protein
VLQFVVHTLTPELALLTALHSRSLHAFLHYSPGRVFLVFFEGSVGFLKRTLDFVIGVRLGTGLDIDG